MKTSTITEIEQQSVSGTSKNKTLTTQVAVIGLGYVGLPLALQVDISGYSVIGFDTNKTRIDSLKKFEAPGFLGEVDAQFAHDHEMELDTDPSILTGSDIFIVCVPTPVLDTHEPDLEPLISATKAVAPYLTKGSMLVIESTVNPGVCDEILLPLIKSMTNLTAEKDFLFAYCPERINPGDAEWDVRSIPRVIGGAGPKSTEAAISFYSKVIDAPLHPMGNVKEAEAVKITENSFRDINIAFVNELAMSFKKLGIDIKNVLEGASTKPFGFMPHYPGCGVGGHCIPVDPYYLIAYAKQNGFTHTFLKAARTINNDMPYYTISLLEAALAEKGIRLSEARVALLGLSYKRNVPDERESPALVIKKALENQGTVVQAFDPYLAEESNVDSLETALRDADAALIATDHNAFASLTPEHFLHYGVTTVIDGRNCLEKEEFISAGITYHGIGR